MTRADRHNILIMHSFQALFTKHSEKTMNCALIIL